MLRALLVSAAVVGALAVPYRSFLHHVDFPVSAGPVLTGNSTKPGSNIDAANVTHHHNGSATLEHQDGSGDGSLELRNASGPESSLKTVGSDHQTSDGTGASAAESRLRLLRSILEQAAGSEERETPRPHCRCPSGSGECSGEVCKAQSPASVGNRTESTAPEQAALIPAVAAEEPKAEPTSAPPQNASDADRSHIQRIQPRITRGVSHTPAAHTSNSSTLGLTGSPGATTTRPLAADAPAGFSADPLQLERSRRLYRRSAESGAASSPQNGTGAVAPEPLSMESPERLASVSQDVSSPGATQGAASSPAPQLPAGVLGDPGRNEDRELTRTRYVRSVGGAVSTSSGAGQVLGTEADPRPGETLADGDTPVGQPLTQGVASGTDNRKGEPQPQTKLVRKRMTFSKPRSITEPAAKEKQPRESMETEKLGDVAHEDGPSRTGESAEGGSAAESVAGVTASVDEARKRAANGNGAAAEKSSLNETKVSAGDDVSAEAKSTANNKTLGKGVSRVIASVDQAIEEAAGKEPSVSTADAAENTTATSCAANIVSADVSMATGVNSTANSEKSAETVARVAASLEDLVAIKRAANGRMANVTANGAELLNATAAATSSAAASAANTTAASSAANTTATAANANATSSAAHTAVAASAANATAAATSSATAAASAANTTATEANANATSSVAHTAVAASAANATATSSAAAVVTKMSQAADPGNATHEDHYGPAIVHKKFFHPVKGETRDEKKVKGKEEAAREQEERRLGKRPAADDSEDLGTLDIRKMGGNQVDIDPQKEDEDPNRNPANFEETGPRTSDARRLTPIGLLPAAIFYLVA